MADAKVAATEYTCKRCGKVFTGRKRRYCSTQCRTYYQLKGPWQGETLPCPECHTVFVQATPPQRFCSESCRWKHGGRERRQRYVSPLECLCVNCGKEYHPTHAGGDGRIFCSRACSDYYVSAYGRDISLTCVQCGAWFIGKVYTATRCQACIPDKEHGPYEYTCCMCTASFSSMWPHVRFCSPICARQSQLRPTVCQCQDCGQEFLREYRQHTTCCQPCVELRAKKVERIAKQLRKARIRAGYRLEGERFEDRDIFERDGWRCQICKRKVSKEVSSVHKRHATIDHIIPLAHGGQHTRVNVQTACRACNMAKSDRLDGVQMRLMG
jgi:5-methylcytosine-specific restriction endonuclease McrA